MRVPFTSPQNHQADNQKPINCNTAVRNTIFQGSTNLCYEPKSVLELGRSPSPTAGKPVSNTQVLPIFDPLTDDPLQLEDHVLNHFEDWDSLMKELGVHDDSTPVSKALSQFSHCDSQLTVLPEFPASHSFDSPQFVPSDFTLYDNSANQNPNHNFGVFEISNDVHHMNNWSLGFDFVSELIRLAECLETNSLQLAHAVLARLNHRLRSPVGKPLQRTAFYFKEALQSLLTGSTRTSHPASSSEVVQTIKAYKAFSNISPIPMFSSFTANQAILEVVDGSALVHIIDFDIGLGGQWASFMNELADKAGSLKVNPPVLRITAVVPEEYAIESRLVGENLTQFARELKIGFDIEFVLIRTFEYLSFKAIKFVEGEKTAVLLSPTIFRRIGTGFVIELRQISPHVVVHVDSEGLMGFGASSLRQCVIDGLELYSTILESLEAANAGGGDWGLKIEMFVLLPKIFEAVEAAGSFATPWREAFVAAGLRPFGLSQFADFQAECLVRRVQVKGFHVAKRQADMVLCWHKRALVATSAWRC